MSNAVKTIINGTFSSSFESTSIATDKGWILTK